MSDGLRRVPIRRVGNRESLMAGGERNWIMMLALLAFVMGITMDIRGILGGIALWVFGLWALRLMAKSDPKMSRVWQRSLRYQSYYPPRSTPYREN